MQPKNNTSAIERVDALIAHIGISQAAFARRCGVEPSNLNKRLSGEVKFTDNYFAKIAHAFNVNFEWLRNGIGEMFTEEKTIGKAQFAAFNQVLDANTSPVSQNIISGDNYQGTLTINATDGKITALEQKIDALTQLLAEKDKLVAEQSNVIAEQRKQIQMLMDLFNRNKKKRETIALCLGHSWADVTDHYIAYGTKRIDDAVRKIIDYVNSDKT